MDIDAAKKAFCNQKNAAKRRGIGWELTFDQWLSWWGADLDNRGPSRDNLQMQRFADQGPYALGNIKKGTPRDNSKTAGKGKQNRASERKKREHQAYLDALMWHHPKKQKTGQSRMTNGM